MTRHWLHREDQRTYCGLELQGLHVTTTAILVTCSECFQMQGFEQAIQSATVEDFEESK